MGSYSSFITAVFTLLITLPGLADETVEGRLRIKLRERHPVITQSERRWVRENSEVASAFLKSRFEDRTTSRAERARALGWLAGIAGQKDYVSKVLKNGNRSEKLAAAIALAESGNHGEVLDCTRVESDPRVRKKCFQQLAYLAERTKDEDLRQKIQENLDNEQVAWIRKKISELLSGRGSHSSLIPIELAE